MLGPMLDNAIARIVVASQTERHTMTSSYFEMTFRALDRQQELLGEAKMQSLAAQARAAREPAQMVSVSSLRLGLTPWWLHLMKFSVRRA
jgi:hypothetical protein